MKILIVHNAYIHAGGEDACVANEISALREAGMQVLPWIVPSDSGFSAKTAAALAPFGQSSVGELESLIQKEKPDIVHAHNLFPLLSPRIFRVARRSGARTVLSLHNYRPLCLNGLFLTPTGEICERCSAGNYLHGITRGCYRGSRVQSAGLSAHLWASRTGGWYAEVDRFIAPAKFLRDRFTAAGWEASRFVVQGHFLPEMPPDPPLEASDYVLYLGRLSEEKGIRWLLDLFENPAAPYRLHIAGEGPLRQEVESRRSPHIRYLGRIQGGEKHRQLSQAAALVVPSECYENFPIAIMEANACGAPALVSDLGGLAEMVATGRNGAVFKRRDPDSFWSALRTLCASDMRKRRETQEHARAAFGATSFMAQRLRLYQDLFEPLSPGAIP
jgi:glycosyltransferase involved in cell wall biosynthesis